MTEKLYYEDAYIKSFSATVISVSERDGRYAAVLDRTAFFPEEGGQYSDRGVIDGKAVDNVIIEDGIIYHILKEPLTTRKTVECEIDFAERYEKMQCHTAEHILSGIIHRLYGLDNVGFHLGCEDVTMDVSAPLTEDQLARVESLANEAVFNDVSVTSVFPKSEELSELQYRSKLDLTENVRIVNIGDYDSCACCAPHVKRTGEIGLIKILDAEKLRGGMRIHIAAGYRAYRLITRIYRDITEISRSLSLPREQTPIGVKKLLSDLEAKKNECKALSQAFFEREADFIEKTEGNLIKKFDCATQDELRSLANKAVDKVEGILVLLSGADGEYKYLLASKSVDLKGEIKKINAALSGRGGGSSVMAQGSFAASLTDIEKYFI